jgi:hypothetical protein
VNWCELMAALMALQVLAPSLRDRSVHVVMDNLSSVYIINRYSTRSARLLPLLRAMCGLCLEYNIAMRATHRPGVENVLPDYLSRPAKHRYDPMANLRLECGSGWSLSGVHGLCSCQLVLERRSSDTAPIMLPLSAFSARCRCGLIRGGPTRR